MYGGTKAKNEYQFGNARRKSEKKAVWFPRRPFLSYGSFTLETGDLRTFGPGAYLPAMSYSEAAAYRGSREL